MWPTKFILVLFLVSISQGDLFRPSIIIVGSGPAGIAAASRLLKNNFTNLKILEAENRIGGRIHSQYFGDGIIDLGAEFCHGEGTNIVYLLAKDFNILKPSNIDNEMFRSNGEIVNKEIATKIMKFAEELELLEEVSPDCKEAKSAGECIKIRIKKFVKSTSSAPEHEIFQDIDEFLNNYVATANSVLDLDDLNLTSNFKPIDGDPFLNWNGLGYKTILDIMTKKYPDPTKQLPIDDKILTNQTVLTIEGWKDANVVVTTKSGEQFQTDHVIFTPSLGVLKADHETLFKPKLPDEKVKAIDNIGFGTILKVFLHFPVKWWKGEGDWALIWTQTDRDKLKKINLEWLRGVSGISKAPNNTNVIILWFSGEHVPYIEGLSQNDTIKGIHHLLKSFFSTQYNLTLPDQILKTTWYSNPHFRGAYSYEKAGSGGQLHEKLAEPLLTADETPSLLFAGEATHPDYYSTVHGAIESGYREADRLLTYYQRINKI